MRRVISVAEALDSSASLRTSSATTAKPRPCSPARAASMAALRASRLVCAAIAVIVSTIPLISCDLSARPRIAVVTSCEASRTLPMATLAWAAAVTPWRATSRVSRAAPAVSSVVRAVSPTAVSICSAVSLAEATMTTWRSAPPATEPTARVISAIARPVSSELVANCSEAALTPRALSARPGRSSRRGWRAWSRRRRSRRGRRR